VKLKSCDKSFEGGGAWSLNGNIPPVLRIKPRFLRNVIRHGRFYMASRGKPMTRSRLQTLCLMAREEYLDVSLERSANQSPLNFLSFRISFPSSCHFLPPILRSICASYNIAKFANLRFLNRHVFTNQIKCAISHYCENACTILMLCLPSHAFQELFVLGRSIRSSRRSRNRHPYHRSDARTKEAGQPVKTGHSPPRRKIDITKREKHYQSFSGFSY
jgi:hypothetical protein